MKDSKLIKLLLLLSPKDIRQVRKMLQSPFFTTKSSLLRLFTILRKYHPDFENPHLEKEILYEKLYPGENYSDTRLRTLFSDMNRIIEDYLILQELNEEELKRRKILLNIYIKKGKSDLFTREANKIENENKTIPYRDIEYYKDNNDLLILRLEFIESKVLQERYELLLSSLENNELIYKLSVAKIKSELKSFSGFADYESPEKTPKDKHLVLQIYKELDLMYDSSSEESIFRIRDLLFQNLTQIRIGYQLEFLTHLLNFSIRLMRVDDLKFNQIALDLYKDGLEHAILTQNNCITDNAYINIVVMGSKSKEFEWVASFMEQYISFLRPDTKEEVSILANAYYFFHKKDIEKSVHLLSQNTFKNPFHNLIARLQLLRSYYEIFLMDSSYYDLINSQCLAFEKMVQRHEAISSEYAVSLLHFSKFIRKLSTIKISGANSKNNKQSLLVAIEHQNITISRSWLIEKINQLEE